MANMNKRKRDIIYPQIVANIGGIEICCNCGATPFDLEASEKDPMLLIDHIDNNNSNNAINNLQLLCRGCNTSKNHPRRPVDPLDRKAPPEFEAGKKNFMKAKKYIRGRMLEPEAKGAIYINELIDDVACYVDCSQTQVKNYLNKLCSKRHGDYTVEDRFGDRFLVWKNDSEMEIVMKHFQESDIEEI